jgi:2-C-methyl-D-erythritol 4-phosphate cytidylyltransferase
MVRSRLLESARFGQAQGVVSVSMLLLASGRGTRLAAGLPKAFVTVGGVPLLVRSLRRLARITEDREVVLAVAPEDRLTLLPTLADAITACGPTVVVDGGDTRQESMERAFAASDPTAPLVLVHDAARPFFPIEAARRALDRAAAVGGALLAVPAPDTLKRVDAAGRVVSTLDRSAVWLAQTPQVARRRDLARAIDVARRDGFAATDDVSLLEHAGIHVEAVLGSPFNLKITTAADLRFAETLAAAAEGDGP